MNKVHFLISMNQLFNLWNLYLDVVFMKKFMKEDIVKYFKYFFISFILS